MTEGAATANSGQPSSRATLGLTGLTINAMALIAPGAFLWLTYQIQALYGAPMAGSAMWFGIVAALLLCFATAISYAELSKLYPGAGSSYFFAEQAFLSKTHAYKFARVAKFITGWASHLYYWVYPGCMVGVTALLSGYLLNQFFPDTFSGSYNSLPFMVLFCVAFALGVAYIAFRGVTGTTGVNMLINIVQITALLVFSVMAISYRVKHGEGSQGLQLVNGTPVDYVVAQEPVMENGAPKKDATGAVVTQNKMDAAGNAGSRDEGRQGRSVHPVVRRGPGHHHGAGRQRPPQGSDAALPVPPVGGLGREGARVLVHLHPGLHRHPDPGRLRVGHVDG